MNECINYDHLSVAPRPILCGRELHFPGFLPSGFQIGSANQRHWKKVARGRRKKLGYLPPVWPASCLYPLALLWFLLTTFPKGPSSLCRPAVAQLLPWASVFRLLEHSLPHQPQEGDSFLPLLTLSCPASSVTCTTKSLTLSLCVKGLEWLPCSQWTQWRE